MSVLYVINQEGYIMLLFYVLASCVVFIIAGSIMHVNRLAIYRRRIIHHYSQKTEQATAFILSDEQENTIKKCFKRGFSTQQCIEKLEQ